jgi:hypothetical protein
MKSVNKYAYMSMLVAVCLFCGCSRGNANGVNQGAAAAYKPLVGTNAFAVVVADYGRVHADPLIRAFNDLAEKKSKEISDAIKAGSPEKVPEKLAKYSEMSRADAIRHFYGVEPSDIKWSVCALEKFDPAAFAEGYPTNFVAPRLYAVVHSSRALDLDKIVAAYRELFQAVCESSPEVSNVFAQATEEYAEFASFSRSEIDGSPAYRMTITDPDSGEKINGIDPLVTTICDGKLLVFAISDDTLAHVKGLYGGTEPSALSDSSIGRELAIPNNILLRFAVADIDKLAAALEKIEDDDAEEDDDEDDDDEEDDDEDDDDGPDPEDISCARFDVGFDSDKTNLFLRVATDFLKADDAERLAKEAQEGITGSMALVQMVLGMKPELAFLGQIVQTLQVANSGNTLAAGLSIPYSAIEAIDSRKLAEMIIDSRKNTPTLPFNLPGGGNDDVEDDVFE